MENLFSYGTLQLDKVQLESFGRLLKGKADRLPGYRLESIEITDPSVLAKSQQQFHPVAIKTGNPGDFIEGVIFEITHGELLEADEYEVADYKRVEEVFASGSTAWVYVSAK